MLGGSTLLEFPGTELVKPYKLKATYIMAYITCIITYITYMITYITYILTDIITISCMK